MNLKDIAVGRQPRLNFLSPEEQKTIYNSALQVLNEVGMLILHEQALKLLKDAGCSATDEGLVTIPSQLVEKALKTAPANIPMYDREGKHTMDLGGTRSYFGTGSDLMYTLDGATMQRHLSVLEDVKRAAKLCDALDNIDFIMSFAHPSDFKPQRAYLASFQAMALNSAKPIVCTAENREDLSLMWEISCILRGSEQELRSKPYFVQYAEPITPLKHPFPSVDKLLLCAEKGVPCIYSPAPIAGSTAPMSIAGHVVQGLAESLCGLVIHQLKAPGAPFLMGMGPAVLDMGTSQCSYSAPEFYMSNMAMTEMSLYLDLPNWSYAGCSDSQLPDGQASLESGFQSLLSGLVGANLNHDVGYLDFGLTGSLEMIAIGDDILDQVRRIKKGIPVDQDTLAVEVIKNVGPHGHFLTEEHTLEHLHATQWRPRLLTRPGYQEWEAAGGKSLFDRAREVVEKTLKEHQPLPVAEEQASKIQKIVDNYKND
jgi:trimethylamine--corrinoid protein Co-methyltransferase